MKKRIIPISLLLICVVITNPTFCQDAQQPFSNAQTRDSLVSIYRNTIERADRLYSGTEYMGYVKRPKGHPFFLSDQFQPAALSFEGTIYRDSILYDLVDDALIIRDRGGEYNIKMVDDKVRWFELDNHQFVRVDSFASASVQIAAGYYEQLYSGTLQALVRHKKQINSHTVQSEVQSEYAQYDTYFIRRGDGYFRVVNTKSLLDVLGEHRNEVRHFLYNQHLNFKKDPANTIRLAATFYDEQSTKLNDDKKSRLK